MSILQTAILLDPGQDGIMPECVPPITRIPREVRKDSKTETNPGFETHLEVFEAGDQTNGDQMVGQMVAKWRLNGDQVLTGHVSRALST